MSFEHLESRLGNVPEVAQPVVQQAPPVYHIADIVDKGVQSVENIIKTFDPLSKAEREAKIAHNAIALHAFQMGREGNLQGMNDLLQYSNGSYDRWKVAIQKETINKLRAQTDKIKHPTAKPETGNPAIRGLFRSHLGDEPGAAAASNTANNSAPLPEGTKIDTLPGTLAGNSDEQRIADEEASK